MITNPDTTVTLTEAEIASLQRLIDACHTRISRLPSDGDFLGWNNYRALQMWDDKLQGKRYDLVDYVEEDGDEEEEKGENLTVDQWLDMYGTAHISEK
jgi:hypothetical protein